MENKHVYAITLAGGQEGSLWPLVRKRKKELFGSTPEESLVGQAITRVHSFVPYEHHWVITTQEQAEDLLPLLVSHAGKIITEPDDRGTAATFVHAAFVLADQDPHAVVVFLPVEHHIPQVSKFLAFLSHAVDFATSHERLVVLGLPALCASSEYGYLAYDTATLEYPAPVAFFHENPPPSLCEAYVKQGFLWNSGIMVCQVGVFLEQCHTVIPEVFEEVYAYLYQEGDYYGIPELSIKKDFLEKVPCVSVLPADFIWFDVNNLEKFLSVHKRAAGEKRVVCIDAHDNLVDAQDSLVALVGVDNVCVVQSDGILLIVHRDQIDKVKNVLDLLKQERNEEYL